MFTLPLRQYSILSLIGATALSCGTLHAQFVQIVPTTADVIIGTNHSGNYSNLGTEVSQFSTPGALIDGNNSTIDTTYIGGAPITSPGTTGTDDSSFVGFNFGSATGSNLLLLQVNFEVFFDGGWFGSHNFSAVNTGDSLAPVLTEPTLQITTDGTTWQTVSDTSDYLTVMANVQGQAQGSSTESAPVTFEMTTPVDGIEGIRIIGLNGGYDGANGGFIGVNEMVVAGETAPEPSTYALMGLGLLALFGINRFRRLV